MLDTLSGLHRIVTFGLCVLTCVALETPQAATVRGVRFGQQGGAARLVIDLQDEVTFTVQPSDNPRLIRLSLPGLQVPSEGKSIRPRHALIEEVRFLPTSPHPTAEIALKAPGGIQEALALHSPPRIVLDITRQAARPTQTAKTPTPSAIQESATSPRPLPPTTAPSSASSAARTSTSAPAAPASPASRKEASALPSSPTSTAKAETPPVTPAASSAARPPAPESQAQPAPTAAAPSALALFTQAPTRPSAPPQATSRTAEKTAPPADTPLPAVATTSLPQTSAQLLEQAERQWTLRQLEAAQQSYQLFLKSYPTHPNNHLIATRVGDILRARGLYREALDAYAHVVATYQGREGAMISQLRMAELGATNPDLAPEVTTPEYALYRQPVEGLQRLIGEFPFSPIADLARIKIGDIFLRQGNVPAALDTLSMNLRRNLPPTLRQEAQHTLREAVLQMMQEQERQEAFAALLQTFFTHKPLLAPIDASHPDLLIPVARSYARLGLLSEAQSLLQGLLQANLSPLQRAQVAMEQATIFAVKEDPMAVLTALQSVGPVEDPALRLGLLLRAAESALQVQRPAEAIQYIQQADAIVSAPGDRARLGFFLGQAYAAQENHAQSARSYHQCASVVTDEGTPTPLTEMCLLAAAREETQQRLPKQALSTYQRLLELFPNSPQKELVLLSLADLYRQMADETRMQATLQQLKTSATAPFWKKLAVEASDHSEWQKRFHERLAQLHNAVMR